MPHHLSLSKTILKIQEHAHYLSSLKNNFKNSRKSHHPMSPFFIENNSKNSRKNAFSKVVPQL
jgi:hypothetical protein